MKKILVMPVKNEEWILEKSLACASLWADHIIVAYQESEDSTLEILKRFPKVVIVENNARMHTSNVRKLLLDAARQFEGQNAIFSFDADEIPTTHILSNEFWNQVELLQPGTTIEMQWINLWRSPHSYRDDSSVWSNSWKQFGFIDDRILDYKTLGVMNDHTSRVPSPELQTNVRFDVPKVLHYQFVDWNRVMSKQAYYRMTEYMQSDKSFVSTLKINLKYYPSKDERNLRTTPVAEEWIAGYQQRGIGLAAMEYQQCSWFDRAVMRYFADQGTAVFGPLDMWDIDWERKRLLVMNDSSTEVPATVITDPRGVMQKVLQSIMPVIYRINVFRSKL